MNNGNEENANKKKFSDFDDFDELEELLSKNRRKNSNADNTNNTNDGANGQRNNASASASGNMGNTAQNQRAASGQNLNQNPNTPIRRTNSNPSPSPKPSSQRPASSSNSLSVPPRRNTSVSRQSETNVAKQRPNSNSNSSPNSNNPPQSNKNIVADAKIREGLQRERTEIFNKLENDEQYRNRHRSSNSPNSTNRTESDGSYRYLGKDIKSNRQKLVDVQPKSKTNRSYRNDTDIIVENRKRQKKNSGSEYSGKEGFVMPSVLKVILYLGAIILVSVVIAINMINIANDIFAFVKKPFSVDITIPEDASIEDIADILSKSELIKYPKIFKLYADYRNKNGEYEFVPGTHPLSSAMNYDELVGKLKKRVNALEEVRIVIPEGYSIDEIIDVFVANGIGTKKEFVNVINNYEFDYRFVKLLDNAELSPDRKYRLEGYLFPDTYDFYKSSTEAQIIKKFLDNFDSKFKEDFYDRCSMLETSVDEIINLASIIEREAKSYDDFPIVSSVFHNRLANSASFPYLQSNATIQYSMDEHKSEFLFMTSEDLAIDVPYNTYKYPGLPPSAICNPGYEAIYAALEPDSTDYFYFVSKNDGTILYGKTSSEHSSNINIARSEE